MTHTPTRRTVAKGAAWSIPSVALASAAPAVAASPLAACTVSAGSCPPASSLVLKTGWNLFNLGASNYSISGSGVSTNPTLNLNLAFTSSCSTGIGTATVTPGATISVTGKSGTTYTASGSPKAGTVNASGTNDNGWKITNWKTNDTLATAVVPVTATANGASCSYTLSLTFSSGNSGSTSALNGSVS